MEDPLTRALVESAQPHLHPAPDVVDEQTTHPQAVRDILDDVTAQAIAAFAVPFFDGTGGIHNEPVVKVGATEAGTVHITAQRNEPAYRAELTLYVRANLRSIDDGHYELRGRCDLSRSDEVPMPHRDFAIRIAIADDGLVALDVDQLRAELAQAIRSFD